MQSYLRWKFTVLLAVMLLQMVVRIVSIEQDWPAEFVEMTGICLVLPAVVAMCEDKRRRTTAIVLGVVVVTLVLFVTLNVGEEPGRRHLVSHSASAIFLMYLIGTILKSLFRHVEVTIDTLMGAFCGYLLIGVVFTELFCAAQIVNPLALRGNGGPFSSADLLGDRWQYCQYFSFATLTTLGYGDILPASSITRSLALLEAVCGQFYLAVLVAGLVGVHATQRLGGNSREPVAPSKDKQLGE